jgi:predicted phosphodiesterase
MKIQILSDLHLEFDRFRPSLATGADVVVLAGDIDAGASGISWARGCFEKSEIVYVAGNHEYYGGVRPQVLDQMRAAAAEHGVHFLENDQVIIGGVRFLGATMWTDFDLFGFEHRYHCMRAGVSGINDFRAIKELKANDNEATRRFEPTDALELHKKSLDWLKGQLKVPFEGRTVVVTHHSPSFLSVPDRFKESDLSACFASRLDYLMGDVINLWIHGHTHDTVDYEVFSTRVVANPRGYVYWSSQENLDFNEEFCVEV